MTLDKLEKNAEIVAGNLDEAKRYAAMAHAAKDEQRQEADWYLEMARRHLEFNNAGLTLVDRMAAEYAQEHAQEGPGVMAMHRFRRAQWAKETAQIPAMVTGYGK